MLKTYKLRISTFYVFARIFWCFISFVITLCCILYACLQEDPTRIKVLLILCGIPVFMSYFAFIELTYPFQIAVSEKGQILFTSLIRKSKIQMKDIVSIKPDWGNFYGRSIIRTENKKIKIINQFDNFHEFITKLKTVNPSIDISGF